MKFEKHIILLIESDHDVAEKDAAELVDLGYEIISADSGPEAILSIQNRTDIDLILMDLLPDGKMNGVETAKAILDIRNLPILFRTDDSHQYLLKESLSVASYGYVSRSGVDLHLAASIESAVRLFRDKSESIKELESDSEILKLFLECNPSYVFFKDSDIKTLKLSSNYEKMLGMPIDRLLGKTMFELFPTDLAKSMDNDDKNILDKGKPFDVEEEMAGHHYSTTKFPIKRANGEILLAGFTMDITRRVEAEQKLHLEIEEHKKAKRELSSFREYLSNIIDSMPSMLIAVDIEGNVTEWNNEAQRKTGIDNDKALGKPLVDFIPRLSGEMNIVKIAIETSREQHVQKKTVQENHHLVYEDITIYPLIRNGIKGAVIRIDDVTERVELNELMVQSEKMLSVGGLAAGMAHEINNPLAGMIQTAAVLYRRLWEKLEQPANIKAAEESGLDLSELKTFMRLRNIPSMFDNLKTSGMRIADIVNNMLSFSRKSEEDVSYINVNNLLDITLKLAATDYNLKKQQDFKQIRIIREYDDKIPDIPCESPKIQQVLLNIFRNGSEAMYESGTDNPTFILRTKIDRDLDMVIMEIEDNGPGINKEIKQKIFDPFYTTKPAGVGAGLGLSVSNFIIKENHKGNLFVQSDEDRGAKFTIHLPVSKKE